MKTNEAMKMDDIMDVNDIRMTYIPKSQQVQWKENKIPVTYFAVKNIFDFILSLLAIVLLSPVFLAIGLIVKLTSPGPVIFKHKRIGYHGEEIEIYKFRSMAQDADNFLKYFTQEEYDEFKKNYKLENDSRITKIGRFLRRSSLDELPQLFNILKGDMSIVGPRPIVNDEVEKYGTYAGTYFSVKPGLTGMWQVCGRSNTTYDERVMLDVKYVSDLSLINDLKLVFKTFGVVISRRGAV